LQIDTEIERSTQQKIKRLEKENAALKKTVSQYKHTACLLTESQKIFQTLFSKSNDAMLIYDESGFIECNETALKMFTCKKLEHFLGHHPGELSPPFQPNGIASNQLAQEKIAEAKRSGKNFFEWVHRRFNGKDFPTEVLLTPINLGDREVLQATIRDITERKKFEEELRHQKALFEAVFLDVPDAMLIADLSRKIIKCTQSILKLFGYSEEELLGQFTAIIYESQEEYERQGRERYNLTAEEKLKPYVINYKRKNGAIFPGETVGAVIMDESDTTIAYIGVIRDITERIQANETLSLQTSELETSNRELESYSYSIAHDLRSPLRTITSFSQILLEDAYDKLNSEEQDHVQRIISSGKKMAQLIDDILELSRISRSELTYDIVNLSQIGAEIMTRLRQCNPDKKVEWQLNDNMTVKGDSQLLGLALQNLLENAWKFTPSYTLAKIKFDKLVLDNKIVYYVKDNGVGFDMKHTDNLFKPFHRLHSPHDFEGTGVGLATVQRIIHRHGGRVWVEAQKDHGSIFYFTLAD